MKSSQGISEQVSSLKNDLQLSEDRLKEAEEIVWKSKAEASELVYALEQEQNSVKKLGAEIEVIQAKGVDDSLKHAEALKAVQSTMSLEVEVPNSTALVSNYLPPCFHILRAFRISMIALSLGFWLAYFLTMRQRTSVF